MEKQSNYTTIKIEKSYIQGTTQAVITIENKAKNTYINLTAWNYSTRTTWGHKGTIWGHIGDKRADDEAKIVYLNRTWECYRFQSLLYKLVRKSNLFKGDDKGFTKFMQRIDEKARAMYL